MKDKKKPSSPGRDSKRLKRPPLSPKWMLDQIKKAAKVSMYRTKESFSQAAIGLKEQPHSVRAEQRILGGLLLDNATWDCICEVMTETDFYRGDHRVIFQHISQLIERNKPADFVTVAESLEHSGKLLEVGGQAYIDSLLKNVTSSSEIRSYAEIVRELAIMRQLAAVGSEIMDSALNPDSNDAMKLIKEAEWKIFKLAEAGRNPIQGFAKIDPFLYEAVMRLDMLYSQENKNDVICLTTGLGELDRMTSGLKPGELTVIAARPSMGKTALAMNIVEHVALELKKSVAVFSMGIPGSQLADRILGYIGPVDLYKLKFGTFHEEDWSRLINATGKLNDAQLFIDDSTGLTAFEVVMRTKRLHNQTKGLNLVIIDYLQLMSACNPSRDDLGPAEITEILHSLKALAVELNVPVVVLSELNRTVDSRQDKRPAMSDFHELGASEQDVDLTLLIYRDEIYFPDKTDAKGKAEVIVSRNAIGPVGTVNLTFIDACAGFVDQSNAE